MARIVLPVILLFGLSGALAQTCQVRYTPPDYPELPVGPPQVRLTLSPSVVTANGAVVQVSATTTAPGATAWVRVRWQGGQLATRDAPYPGYAPLLSPNPVQGCPTVTASTRPITGPGDNGMHTFLAEAYAYWKAWRTDWSCRYRDSEGNEHTTTVTTGGEAPGSPYYACTYLRGYWQVNSGVVSATERLPVYVSWERALDYDGVYREFATRLLEDHKRAGGSMLAYAFAKEVPEPVRGALKQVAQGYFYDCNWLGICQRADPAGEIKYLTDVPSALTDLVATGRLCGGFITFCFGERNARVSDIGPKVEIKTFLMVKGWRHDYLLMDRLIPRKYYDPADPYYPGVPEDERQQVLQGCQVYKDTEEGRRCVALVETPTGIVPTLKTLLMIDPLFRRGRQYP
jgi:hypothetical protein